jgi:hypothetical protein
MLSWKFGSGFERRDEEKMVREVRRVVSLIVLGRGWVVRVNDVGCWFGFVRWNLDMDLGIFNCSGKDNDNNSNN